MQSHLDEDRSPSLFCVLCSVQNSTAETVLDTFSETILAFYLISTYSKEEELSRTVNLLLS